jgi:hypothetical protein
MESVTNSLTAVLPASSAGSARLLVTLYIAISILVISLLAVLGLIIIS